MLFGSVEPLQIGATKEKCYQHKSVVPHALVEFTYFGFHKTILHLWKYKNSQNKEGSMHFFTKYIFEKKLDTRKCFTQKWKMRKE